VSSAKRSTHGVEGSLPIQAELDSQKAFSPNRTCDGRTPRNLAIHGRLQGSFDCASVRFANPCSAQDDNPSLMTTHGMTIHYPTLARAGILKNSRTRAFTTSPAFVIMVSRMISSCRFSCSLPSFTMYSRKVVMLRAYI